jgi:hypothetical protein
MLEKSSAKNLDDLALENRGTRPNGKGADIKAWKDAR